MPFELPPLSELGRIPFDTVIDVRSPAEYAEDHVPGAINLPVLSNEERAEVGTIYTQESPFKARKIGAALVSRNAAHHLETALRNKDGGWRPLVYCWRGGQRSGSFATILSQVGWRTETLQGGYQTYRRAIVAGLYDAPPPFRFVLLDGNTGTAKTELLARLSERGVQTLDLEGLANHRGSVLGPRPGGQPAQKGFDSGIAARLFGFDASRPVVVEAESSKVGDLLVPPGLWKGMQAAPRITVAATVDDRARYLARAYRDLTENREQLYARLRMLIPLQGHEKVEAWVEMARSGAFEALASALVTEHYDARYARSRGTVNEVGRFEIGLQDGELEGAANRLAQAISVL